MVNTNTTWNKYSSKLLLFFKDKEIENQYQKYVYNKKSFLTLSIFVFLCVLANTLVFYLLSHPEAFGKTTDIDTNQLCNKTLTNTTTNTTNTTVNQECELPFILKTTLINNIYAWCSFSFILIALLTIIPIYFTKRHCIPYFRILSVLINLSIRLFFSTMSVWYSQVFQTNVGNSQISAGIQSTTALVFVMFFDYSYWLNSIVQMSLVFIYLGMNNAKYSALQHFFIVFINIVFYVFFFFALEKSRRDGFYYSNIIKQESQNLQELFDNLGLGLVIYKNNEPMFINKYVKEKLFKIDGALVSNNSHDSTPLELFINSTHCDIFKNEKLKEYINNFIFEDIKFTNMNVSDDEIQRSFDEVKGKYEKNEFTRLQLFSIYMELFKKYKTYFHNFKFLGVKETTINSEIINIQIFAKYNSDSDKIEILYNDVTNISRVEEYKAEVKYKTLFLSKAAHEFKNPLFCITELINQIKDQEERNGKDYSQAKTEANMNDGQRNNNSLLSSYNNIKNVLQNIKNLSDYMIILVKDFDFLSQKELKKQFTVDISKTNLLDIIQFVVNIFITKIQLNEKRVRIYYEIDDNLPKFIQTDETRLKQILINIISNSYKFTDQGKIKVELIADPDNKDCIKFSVSDTGIGIPPDKIHMLTTPFCKLETKNNQHGAGLGLSIVIDMVNMLGKDFKIKSEIGGGATTISFTIPYSPEKTEQIDPFSTLVNANKEEKKKYKKSFFSNKKVNKYNYILETDVDFSREPDLIVEPSYRDNNNIDKENNSSNTVKLQDVCLYINNSEKNKAGGGDYKSSGNVSLNVKSSNHSVHLSNDSICFKPKNNSNNNASTNEGISLKFTNNLSHPHRPYKMIVVEDEILIQQSGIRVIKNYFKNIGEACEIISCVDGVECLNVLYQGKLNGIKYDAILTDESMSFIKGTLLIKVLDSIISEQIIFPLRIFMATSYDRKKFTHIHNIDEIFTKPINSFNVEKMHALLLNKD